MSPRIVKSSLMSFRNIWKGRLTPYICLSTNLFHCQFHNRLWLSRKILIHHAYFFQVSVSCTSRCISAGTQAHNAWGLHIHPWTIVEHLSWCMYPNSNACFLMVLHIELNVQRRVNKHAYCRRLPIELQDCFLCINSAFEWIFFSTILIWNEEVALGSLQKLK